MAGELEPDIDETRKHLFLTIMDASFQEDKADMFSKQDPFIQFQFKGVIYRTKVKIKAGLYAEF